ncbi:HepT-like ribonuclease domain-containing protein [Microbacterium karelineae]|uniref:HepT-like ribonuclease domain-containing protein n=1 Tax=Microbacterium karelineae TaxID=2654283 RepID=UPI0012E9B1D2|nr:HepT-like ribonuclease domain-containing protein [Microbacterium karelineae]
MTPRRQRERLEDILECCEAIAQYVAEDPGLDDGIHFDATRARVLIIGEAVSHLHSSVRARAPEVAWHEIVGMRNIVIHEYFDTAHAVVLAAAHEDVPRLKRAVRRILDVGDLDYERSPMRTD